jgi:CRP-like cAMP-binding protein
MTVSFGKPKPGGAIVEEKNEKSKKAEQLPRISGARRQNGTIAPYIVLDPTAVFSTSDGGGFFSGLSPLANIDRRVRQNLIKKVTVKRYPPQAVVLSVDDPLDKLFLLTKGQVTVIYADGSASLEAKGSFFGKEALGKDLCMSKETVMAKTLIELRVLEREDYLQVANLFARPYEPGQKIQTSNFFRPRSTLAAEQLKQLKLEEKEKLKPKPAPYIRESPEEYRKKAAGAAPEGGRTDRGADERGAHAGQATRFCGRGDE